MKAWVLLLLIVLSSHHVFAQDSINADSVRQITLKHIIANDSLGKILPMVRGLKSKRLESERIIYYDFINKKLTNDNFKGPANETVSFSTDFSLAKSNLTLAKYANRKRDLTYEDVLIVVFTPDVTEEYVYVATRLDYDNNFHTFVLFKYDFSLKLLSVKYFSVVH